MMGSGGGQKEPPYKPLELAPTLDCPAYQMLDCLLSKTTYRIRGSDEDNGDGKENGGKDNGT